MNNKINLISISGLGWTGSSVIIDFLYQNELVIGLNNDYPTEMILFDRKYSLFDFLVFMERNQIPINSIDHNLLISVLSLGHLKFDKIDNELVSSFFKELELNKYPSILDYSLIPDIYETSIINALDKFKDSLYRNKKKFIEFLFFDLLEKCSNSFDKTICLNNDPSYKNLILSRSNLLFREYIIIRNPLDTIADRIRYDNISFGLRRISYTSLSAMLLTWQYFRILLLSMFSKKRVLFFEELVLDDNVMFIIANYISHNSSIDELNYSGTHYNKAFSAMNINIYKSILSKIEISIIYFTAYVIYKVNRLLFKHSE